MKPTEATLTALATYRVTKLIMEDELFSEARDAAYSQIDKIKNDTLREKLTYLTTCPWCLSVYAAGVLLTVKIVAPKVYEYLTLLLASSAATGIIFQRV